MPMLRGGEAGEDETEEGVGVGVEADLGVRGGGGIGRIGGARRIGDAGRGGIGASETFVVDTDVHGSDGTEGGIDQEGDSHGIEKGGRLLAPLMVEDGEGVGQRSSLAEEVGALDLVKLELRSVEGHDEEGHACDEEFLCRGDVVENVPFGLRWRGRAEPEVAVAALDGTAHHNDALELVERGGILVDGGADVHQRADGEERDLAGVAADLIKKEDDGVRMRRRLGEAAGLGVAALGEGALRGGGRAGSYGDVRTPDFSEEAVEKLGAGFGVAKSSGDAEDLEFGATESEGDGEGIVNVVSDVGVDDDFFGRGFLWGIGRGLG